MKNKKARVCIENCHNCDKRHGGCTVDSSTFTEVVCKFEKCPEFILGKCFYCAMYQLEDESQCIDVFYPCGCVNFKEGNNFDEYLHFIKNDNNNNILDKDKFNNIYSAYKEVEKKKSSNRRKNTKKYKRKMMRKAKENKYIRGPWYDEDKSRVIIIDRGKRSKWIKQQAHRKVRRQNYVGGLLFNKGQYMKQYDYWWELD